MSVLEHLNVAAAQHLIDVADRDAARGKRGPDAFASPIPAVVSLLIEGVVELFPVGQLPGHPGLDGGSGVVDGASDDDHVSLEAPTVARRVLEQVLARARR